MSAATASGGSAPSPAWRWLAFYAAIAAAWSALAATHLELTRARLGAGGLLGAEFWRAMCVSRPSFGALAAMWSLMAVAMMAPAAAPMLRTYEDLIAAGAARGRGFWALLAGFLAVWLALSIAGASAQLALQGAGLLAPDGSSLSPALTASLLLAAGLYQFTPLKHACLRACRAPITRFVGDWRAGSGYAFRKGVVEGLLCLGCCWALMSLAFALGVMNLAFMALGTALMIAEKTGLLGRRGTHALGAALCAAALIPLT